MAADIETVRVDPLRRRIVLGTERQVPVDRLGGQRHHVPRLDAVPFEIRKVLLDAQPVRRRFGRVGDDEEDSHRFRP